MNASNIPENFIVLLDRAEYRPVAEVSLGEAIHLVTTAIHHTRKHKKPKLLVDTSKLVGFPSPTVVDRYYFVRTWAMAANGELRIAMVTRSELIDPQKFGVTVGANAGLICDVFTTEAEALAWLQDA